MHGAQTLAAFLRCLHDIARAGASQHHPGAAQAARQICTAAVENFVGISSTLLAKPRRCWV
jgi:hypothetical protein